jgi:hypothetical protein
MTLMLTLATALALLTATEIGVSGQYRGGADALYAAEAAAAVAADELLAAADWNAILGGGLRSRFSDGLPGALRSTPSGPLDIVAETEQRRCGRRGGCSDEERSEVTAERPWGVNNPMWQPYAYGSLRDLVGVGPERSAYVVVWVGDDGAECDGRPDIDGGPCPDGANAGAGMVLLQAVAFGVGGVQRGVELAVARGSAAGADPSRRAGIVSWREIQ